MKFTKLYFILSLVLLAVSAVSYIIQIALFHKADDTFFYMLQDISFVPIQVLFVTLILDRLLKKREKQSLFNKLNMVIGVFYNDIGNRLLDSFGKFTVNISEIGGQLKISSSWDEKKFKEKMKTFAIHPDDIILDVSNLSELKEFLILKNQGLLNMLANPNLLEHDTFTNLLWAVFHLADELMHRDSLNDLPKTDMDHLKVDLIRAYKLVIYEWLSYMKHLKKDYPYLFSIAVRTNPFNSDADIVVK
jgi:hypothetical protein